ncbi:DUF6765 family protein [Spirochaeta africana]|uniref:Uncharacterized protein n=1 Tax=Spirochaeta africana (strain ATCC 700263 / DSM 8902 / Z-7692) TaxID=889378 RepID=H9UHL5_SPIAZ|nr:DUF6765 family protein [Spirochaeta africana]AFG37008.1 hypothetical protein Spiaf_0919 [Spirochaeta africana DSM 8902]
MNGEFHYYWTWILASEAGLSETDAEILAISAQYPDENIDPVRVRTPQGSYDSVTTHHYGFWSSTAHREILVPFHFIPGDPEIAAAARRDHAPAPWTVTPKSPIAKRMLINALKTRNLYRIGIALHAYADTWAHQNFSGLQHPANQRPQTSRSASRLLPPIGHAQYRLKPDILHSVWHDRRLVPEQQRVVNRDRFFAAARMIYRYLCTFNHRNPDNWPLVRDRLERLIGPPGHEKSPEERLLDYQIEFGVPPAARHSWKAEALLPSPGSAAAASAADSGAASGQSAAVQEKLRWFRDELLERSSLRERAEVTAAAGFYDSHWYRWMEAARAHRGDVEVLLLE